MRIHMNQRTWVWGGIAAVLAGSVIFGCQSMKGGAENPRVVASSSAAQGKYLVQLGGCNECHTPGFDQLGSKTPEDVWLTGVPVGFRGPWGTTYASNLRLFVFNNTEDIFVATLRARVARPPMPWTSLQAMSDSDLRALYQYIKSLPKAGAATPEFVAAGVEPKTPYIVFEPVAPKAQ